MDVSVFAVCVNGLCVRVIEYEGVLVVRLRIR